MRKWQTLLITLSLSLALPAAGATYASLPAALFKSAIPPDATLGPVVMAPFQLRTEPVTNGEFLAFVKKHPEWRRDQVSAIFAESRYLAHWQAPAQLGDKALPDQPVTQVSWYAARAFCETENATLPTWYQWEYAAAADEKRADARSDPAWLQHILDWYARPSSAPLPAIGGKPNYYGVRDLHGLVWEWVDDFNALLVASDSRNQNSADKSEFCGAGSIGLDDKENFATMMRIAMLSSLGGQVVTRNLGFRCARPLPPLSKGEAR